MSTKKVGNPRRAVGRINTRSRKTVGMLREGMKKLSNSMAFNVFKDGKSDNWRRLQAQFQERDEI